jgi:hypothetical protein
VGEVICYLEFCGHKSIDAKAVIDVTGQGLGFARHEESLSQPIPHAFPILAFSFHDLHQVEEIKKKPGIFVAISTITARANVLNLDPAWLIRTNVAGQNTIPHLLYLSNQCIGYAAAVNQTQGHL